MDSKLDRCFDILEISRGSTYEEAYEAYWILAQVWCPDKHTNNDIIHTKATIKLNEIIAAWRYIETYYKRTAKEADIRNLARREHDERQNAERIKNEHLIYTDQQTGLMWPRDGNTCAGFMKWDVATTWVVKDLNYAGYNDWRLPSRDELESFAKRGGNRPSEWFNSNGFKNVQACRYWTGTVYLSSAWRVDMLNGELGQGHRRMNSYYVWPVRYCG